MSQVAIIIDVPHYSAETLAGNALLRVAEDTARALRKLVPVDDGVRVLTVAQAETLVVSDPSAEDEWAFLADEIPCIVIEDLPEDDEGEQAELTEDEQEYAAQVEGFLADENE
jgi:hypothetical protein